LTQHGRHRSLRRVACEGGELVQQRIVIGLGVVIGLLSIPHAFLGLPDLWRQLTAAGVSPDLRGAIAVGWCFGSLSMVTLGLLVIWCGVHGGALARRCAITVGLAYMAFGAGSMLYRGLGPHFIGFLVIGFALTALALRGQWAR
jgi:hypothetical protein